MSRITSETAVTSLVDADVLLIDNPTLGTRKIAHSDLKAQYEVVARKGVAGGYAALDANGLVPAAQLRPALVPEVAADDTALAALTVVSGDIGKRLVRVTATGISWLAMTAGSGADKWVQYSSEPAASTSAPGIVQLVSSSDAETNDLKALTLAEFLRRLGPYRSALAAENLLSFNGTAAYPYTNVTAIGSGGHVTVALSFDVPETNPSEIRTLFNLCGAAQGLGDARQLNAYIQTDGTLVFRQNGATTSDWRIASVTSNLVSAYAGTRATLIIAISPASAVCEINGQSAAFTETTAGTAPAWGDSMTGTYLYLGSSGSDRVFIGAIRLIGIANYTLTTAQRKYVYLNKTFPAADFCSASNTAARTSDFSAGTDNFSQSAGGGNIVGNTDGIGGLNDWLLQTQAGGGPLGIYDNTKTPVLGRKYRMTGTVRHDGASVTSFTAKVYGDGVNSMSFAVAPNTNVDFDVTFNSPVSTAVLLFVIQSNQSFASGEHAYYRNIKIYDLGLLCCPEANPPGNGLVWNDKSGNGAHLILSTSGVAWTLPSNGVNRVTGRTSTAGNQQLLGATIIGTNFQLLRIRARSLSGTPTVTLGAASGGSEFVAAVALSTAWKTLTIAAPGTSPWANGGPLWCGSTTTDIVEWEVIIEPTANSTP